MHRMLAICGHLVKLVTAHAVCLPTLRATVPIFQMKRQAQRGERLA